VLPVIEALAAQGLVVSVDTRKAAVMRAAVKAGARIVNDVSGLTYDEAAAGTVAALGVPVILMHMRGTPDTMMTLADYEDAALDVFDELAERVRAAEAAGIARKTMMIDPGIGFAKGTADNLRITRRLALLHGLGLPVLYAASRKRFIGEITGVDVADARLAGSLAVAQLAFLAGAHMVRVHDVAETAQMARVLQAAGHLRSDAQTLA
jgi:dihydropteroate synthase